MNKIPNCQNIAHFAMAALMCLPLLWAYEAHADSTSDKLLKKIETTLRTTSLELTKIIEVKSDKIDLSDNLDRDSAKKLNNKAEICTSVKETTNKLDTLVFPYEGKTLEIAAFTKPMVRDYTKGMRAYLKDHNSENPENNEDVSASLFPMEYALLTVFFIKNEVEVACADENFGNSKTTNGEQLAYAMGGTDFLALTRIQTTQMIIENYLEVIKNSKTN